MTTLKNKETKGPTEKLLKFITYPKIKEKKNKIKQNQKRKNKFLIEMVHQ